MSADLATAADETRRFRHVAMRADGAFDASHARPAVAAARTLHDGIACAVAAFRRTIDPD